MAISEKDLKKLWGLAGGICSHPQCNCDCIPFLDESDPTVIGEMAHVIAKSAAGPRADGVGGDDTYANLILLCPTHHTLIDKAPQSKFPVELLHQWKADHESALRRTLTSPVFGDRNQLFGFLGPLLVENHACWKTYGPEGALATTNPVSNAHRIWDFRKIAIIVPNNSRIASAIKQHRSFFKSDEYRLCADFIEHAAGFEHNCYTPYDDVPRFPAAFEEMVNDERK